MTTETYAANRITETRYIITYTFLGDEQTTKPMTAEKRDARLATLTGPDASDLGFELIDVETVTTTKVVPTDPGYYEYLIEQAGARDIELVPVFS